MGMRWEQQKLLQNMHSTSSRRWCLIPSTTTSSQLQYKLTQQVASKEQKGKEQREKKIILLRLNLKNTTLARWSSISSVQLLSRVRQFATSWTTAHQASLSSSTPRACSNPCPSSWWCIQPSHPLSPPSPPAFNISQHQSLFRMSQFCTSGGQSIGSRIISPMTSYYHGPLDWLTYASSVMSDSLWCHGL